jgi:hypothetical protein
MALFPGSAGEGGNLRAWMDAYEKFLYAQMEENFRREQEASKEVAAEAPKAGTGSDYIEFEVETDNATVEEDRTVPVPTEVETAAESAEAVVLAYSTPLYSVDGYIPDEGLQTYMYQRLCEHGICYFFPYAVCLIAQESTWNPMAENKNGRDKGLLQFRVEYVPWMDWRNPYQQIDYFVAQMANRAKNGKTVSEMISAHNQSDWGPYCQSYVDAVMQHSNTLARVR